MGPQPFDWDADSGERILEMFNIMSVVCDKKRMTFEALRAHLSISGPIPRDQAFHAEFKEELGPQDRRDLLGIRLHFK